MGHGWYSGDQLQGWQEQASTGWGKDSNQKGAASEDSERSLACSDIWELAEARNTLRPLRYSAASLSSHTAPHALKSYSQSACSCEAGACRLMV